MGKDIETIRGPPRLFKPKVINTEIINAYILSKVCTSEIIEPGLQDLWGYANSLKQDPAFPRLLSLSSKSTVQNVLNSRDLIYVHRKN